MNNNIFISKLFGTTTRKRTFVKRNEIEEEKKNQNTNIIRFCILNIYIYIYIYKEHEKCKKRVRASYLVFFNGFRFTKHIIIIYYAHKRMRVVVNEAARVQVVYKKL
jgi:hypothetical protein